MIPTIILRLIKFFYFLSIILLIITILFFFYEVYQYAILLYNLKESINVNKDLQQKVIQMLDQRYYKEVTFLQNNIVSFISYIFKKFSSFIHIFGNKTYNQSQPKGLGGLEFN